jgi:type I restriction enzyme S subunit
MFFRFFEAQLALKGTGTTFNAITQNVVKNLEIPIPPLDEQRRIVSRIEELFSELDNCVSTLQKTKEQLAVYRQAVLKEAFEGRFTEHKCFDLRLQWATKEEIKALPAIPAEWNYVSLSQLGDFGRGKSKHRPRNDKSLFVDGNVPFVQTGDVANASIYIGKCSSYYNQKGLDQSKLWDKGTLCMTIAANIGDVAILDLMLAFLIV